METWSRMYGWRNAGTTSRSSKRTCATAGRWRQFASLSHRWFFTSPPTTMSARDRKSTRLNSSHSQISYAVFCLKKKTNAQRLRDHGGDLLRPIFLIAELHLDVLPHLALDRLDGSPAGRDPLILGGLSYTGLSHL